MVIIFIWFSGYKGIWISVKPDNWLECNVQRKVPGSDKGLLNRLCQNAGNFRLMLPPVIVVDHEGVEILVAAQLLDFASISPSGIEGRRNRTVTNTLLFLVIDPFRESIPIFVCGTYN
jgi:hypothetical protein